MRIRRAALVATALLGLLPAPARAQSQPFGPVTLYEPTIDTLPEVEGTGLCAASALSDNVDFDFYVPLPRDNPGERLAYNDKVNAFITSKIGDAEAEYHEYVVRTVLDLSNNNSDLDDDQDPNEGGPLSYGDFTGLMSTTCQQGGCDFPWNSHGTSQPFGSRLRGFLLVPEEMAGRPVHIGFYADDAVSLTFWDKSNGVKPVMVRPARLGLPTWRLTNTVIFVKPGLYPLEILYVEIAEHAALEMSYFVGDFDDFELGARVEGSESLKAAGYSIFQPAQFFQTMSGSPSFPDLDQCQQCNRQFAGQSGTNGCPGSYYCNEAALCAPCDTARFCGESCSACTGDTLFCINLEGRTQCAECRTSADCQGGFVCDPETHECKEEYECEEDPDCPRDKICVDHTCVLCDTSDRCAGNSCNCCPNGINGTQMDCAAVEPGGTPMCVECLTDEQCPDGKVCHLPTGHCMDRPLPTNALPNCCGEGCVDCMHPEDPNDPQSPPVPFCLPGPIGTACAACRNDMDCAEGQYCLSGECKECVKDRRCGPRCDSCGGDTPFCFGQFSELAVCVRCTSDEQCAGTTCNRETHQCDPPGCMATCGEDTPYCDGERCVECYADTQCPCGNTCDLATNTCDISCKTNLDCLGNEHCRWTDEADAKECALGPMPDNVACGGTLAEICSVSAVGQKGADPRAAGLVALAALALIERKRRRRSGGAS
ncbi:outer membrane exchange protein TraA family protein [Sorangium cellulosum]|uniref:outer membrane exchange protein TraA family protein n=1 Tax=Sorangium cellulosum TaxID=56 RepID=UPI0012FF6A87|nr:outer membrane exchange protein TraA family protein [Sorangium cellulosum]